MNTCRHCQSPTAVGARFCAACGAPQSEQSTNPGDTGQSNPAPWKTVLGVMFQPGELVKQALSGLSWPAALAVSGLALSLLTFQAGLDLRRVGTIGMGGLGLLVLKGALIGTVGVAGIALLAAVFVRPFEGMTSFQRMLVLFGLSYAPALVYAVFGLFLNIAIGWNTAVGCGVTGLLWALGPIYIGLREVTKGKAVLTSMLATICGGSLLLLWGVVGLGGG